MAVRDLHYKDLRKAILAISDALNEELHGSPTTRAAR